MNYAMMIDFHGNEIFTLEAKEKEDGYKDAYRFLNDLYKLNGAKEVFEKHKATIMEDFDV